jgi:hypothetical protein
MLNKEDAIRIETISYGKSIKNGKLRSQKVFIFQCGCGSEIRSQQTHLKVHSGKCVKCAQFNEPFMAAFNEMVKSCLKRKIDISIFYEDFIEFTKTDRCHYCSTAITWHPHTKKNSKDVKGARSYKLDRMDNNVGYHKNNCVVCCKRCNQGKSNDFSYEEWFGMTQYLRKKHNGL